MLKSIGFGQSLHILNDFKGNECQSQRKTHIL